MIESVARGQADWDAPVGLFAAQWTAQSQAID
jgi:hypothetical protein